MLHAAPRFDSMLAGGQHGPIPPATADHAGSDTLCCHLLSAPETTTAPAQTTKVNLFYFRSVGLQPSPITGQRRGDWPLIQPSGAQLWDYSWLGLAQCYVTKRKIHVVAEYAVSSARCRSLDALDLAELERCRDAGAVQLPVASGEKLACPRTRYRPIDYFPRTHGLPILLDFRTLHVHQDQDVVVLNTTDMEPGQRRYCDKIGDEVPIVKLFISERSCRIYFGGRAPRCVAREKGHDYEKTADDSKCKRIGGFNAIQHTGQEVCEAQGRTNSYADPQQCHNQPVAHHEPQRVTLLCAQCHANTNLISAQHYRVRDHTVKSDSPDQQCHARCNSKDNQSQGSARHRSSVVIIQCVHLEERKVGSCGPHCVLYLVREAIGACARGANGESDTAPYSLSWNAVDLKRQDRPIHRNRRFLIEAVLMNVSHNADNLSPIFRLLNLLAHCIRRSGPVLTREVL